MAAGASSTATDTAMSGASTRGGSILPGPPPPTPSNHHQQQQPPAASARGADAALSAFLHRMLLSSPAPPLRSPSRTRSPHPPPLVSLDAPDQGALRDAAGTGYFHLAGHGVPSELPSAALAELARIDASARRESNLRALGFGEEEEEDADGGAEDPVVVFDASEGETDDALPASVAEYARRMRDVGMRVVALLSGCPDSGFHENPFAEGKKRSARCLVWASKVSAGDTTAAAAPPEAKGQVKDKAYPYVVGLHCQWDAAGQEPVPASWVVDDGGEWTAVGARDGAMLVTIGDIAQVWSNGRLRKVRGMARPASAAPRNEDARQQRGERLSVAVLITLSLDSVVSPLVPCSDGDDEAEDGAGGDEWRFHSFLLEDYAWRVYHQRLQFKDPLLRYRI